MGGSVYRIHVQYDETVMRLSQYWPFPTSKVFITNDIFLRELQDLGESLKT